MLVQKAEAGSYQLCIIIEDNNEGGQELLFRLNQAEEIDEQLRTYACLDNSDQRYVMEFSIREKTNEVTELGLPHENS